MSPTATLPEGLSPVGQGLCDTFNSLAAAQNTRSMLRKRRHSQSPTEPTFTLGNSPSTSERRRRYMQAYSDVCSPLVHNKPSRPPIQILQNSVAPRLTSLPQQRKNKAKSTLVQSPRIKFVN